MKGRKANKRISVKVGKCNNDNFLNSSSFIEKCWKLRNKMLAVSLNDCKIKNAELLTVITGLNKHILELNIEMAELRSKSGNHEMNEQEHQRVLKVFLDPIKCVLRKALENTVGITDNLSEALRLTSEDSRKSSTICKNSDENRNARISIVNNGMDTSCSDAGPPCSNVIYDSEVNNKSSPGFRRMLGKVSPMVAGHAISTKPLLQLFRLKSFNTGTNGEVSAPVSTAAEAENSGINVMTSTRSSLVALNPFNVSNILEEEESRSRRQSVNEIRDDNQALLLVPRLVLERVCLTTPSDVSSSVKNEASSKRGDDIIVYTETPTCRENEQQLVDRLFMQNIDPHEGPSWMFDDISVNPNGEVSPESNGKENSRCKKRNTKSQPANGNSVSIPEPNAVIKKSKRRSSSKFRLSGVAKKLTLSNVTVDGDHGPPVKNENTEQNENELSHECGTRCVQRRRAAVLAIESGSLREASLNKKMRR